VPSGHRQRTAAWPGGGATVAGRQAWPMSHRHNQSEDKGRFPVATLRVVAPRRHGCDGTKAGVERRERAVGARERPTLMPARTGAEQPLSRVPRRECPLRRHSTSVTCNPREFRRRETKEKTAIKNETGVGYAVDRTQDNVSPTQPNTPVGYVDDTLKRTPDNRSYGARRVRLTTTHSAPGRAHDVAVRGQLG
jgi:hypothetical protein